MSVLETVQSRKCLPHQREGPSLVSKTHTEKVGNGGNLLSFRYWGGRDGQISGAHVAVSQADLVSYRFQRENLSQQMR